MADSWKSSAFLTLGLLVVVLAESSVDDRHHQHHNHHHVSVDNDGSKSLVDDLTSPDVSFDTKGWRALSAAPQPETFPQPETAFPETSEVWKEEEVQPQPARRRRPGRKRKRRPYIQTADGNIPAEQDGVRFNIEGGVQVVVEDGDRMRQRRPQRLQDDQHWRGEARDERPLRRRGNRRRQRPYLPNLENGGQSFPIKVDTSFQVNNSPGAHIRVVGEDYKMGSVIDEVNGAFENNDQAVVMNEDVEVTTEIYEENREQIKDMTEKEEPVTNNKSYRRPYSQSKKQETEFSMGTSSDLKALLKQSGGLSLSEVLQQRNLSLADLLTGKQHALSALKTPAAEDGFKPISPNQEDENQEIIELSGKRRRLPAVSRDNQSRIQRVKPTSEGSSNKIRENIRSDQTNRRRLPNTSSRRQKPKVKESTVEPKETTTEKNEIIPKKSTSDNLISQTSEQDEKEEITESTVTNNEEDETPNFVTTTEVITTTAKKEEVRNRLSLKPRLRLPSVKMTPKRILNPDIKPKEDNRAIKNKISRNENAVQNTTVKKASIPSQAIPISIKEMFGMSDIISAAKIITKAEPGSKGKENITTTTTTTTTTTKPTTTTTTVSPKIEPTSPKSTVIPKISAKDEILEILTDKKGGEKLAKILAERNMTLKELVDHRERGSSQVHLADIFHNASREPDPAEPFLAKSLIEPISKEIYPLKALLEGNMRDTTGSNKQVSDSSGSPPMFVDLTKTSQNEESLGIVTLFDKFSEFVGHPKIFDAKEMKKDSDGSTYFTSVISVKPTDEAYRESRSETGFYNSHKQVSEIFSSIPTYVKSDNVVEAKVVPDWNERSIFKKKNPLEIEQEKVHIDKDVDGDGLIVLDDLQRIEQIDNDIVQASNQKSDKNYINQNQQENEREPNFYTRLPVGVRSAIIVSSSIIGTSLVVFLTIFVACKVRQRKRNLLKYNDSFSVSRVRSPIIDGSRKLKKNSSSRSISPILTVGETTYKNQKINTMDSQTQREAQDYLWDSLRRPFQ